MQVRSLGFEDPLKKERATHSGILAGKFHGQRSLGSYSPCGCKESDTTEIEHAEGTREDRCPSTLTKQFFKILFHCFNNVGHFANEKIMVLGSLSNS